MPKLDPALLHKITKRGVAEIIIESEFVERLEAGKPLRLKMGFDPSRPDLHLGHVVGLRKLRQLQDLGHEVVLIVGDWTARIGDPSGQSDTRTMLSEAEVKENAETYMRQFFKVIDPGRTRAVYQSEWFGAFTLATVIDLTSKFTVNQFLHREDFARRYEANQPLAVTELLYPLMQAYDSVAIEADVEFGGTDQKFNLLVGRELQEKSGQRPQQCFLMPILPGTDGVRRMGKSLGNYIAIEDTPHDIFFKVMRLPDAVVPLYFELLTDVPDAELAEIRTSMETKSAGAMELKKRLAHELTAEFHSAAQAQGAQAEFESEVQRGETPSDVPEFAVTASADGVINLTDDGAEVYMPRFLRAVGLAESGNEALRLLKQGAVEIDGRRVMEYEPDTRPALQTVPVAFGSIIRAGRRRFVRVTKG